MRASEMTPEPVARAVSIRSVEAVEAGDREAWLALFGDDAVVEDPIGPSPFDPTGEGHRGIGAIRRFYDTVIAPNSVRFDIHSSHAGGDEVANVCTITTTMADGSKAIVDAVSTYRVDAAGRLVALRAYWEMGAMRFEPSDG
ncbi:MAG: nuclear transport factor 2 family protein [Microthrixaceae bacterium]